MTKHKVLLKLEAAVPMTPYNDGVVGVSMQIAQVSSALVIPNVVLPPLRARAGFQYDSCVVFSYVT